MMINIVTINITNEMEVNDDYDDRLCPCYCYYYYYFSFEF